mmetsp:Transcript_58185/g.69402  ORF Transcript_58185/g.69402 Transcript_58185/m.69402 type:complete len:104 (+) Transcript_58185:97-408(+)
MSHPTSIASLTTGGTSQYQTYNATMTLQGKDDPDIPIATAIPAKPNGTTDVQESNIPAGHSRFYCSKCHAPYDLPDRCTTWRWFALLFRIFAENAIFDSVNEI